MLNIQALPPINLLEKLRCALQHGHSEIVLTTSWIIEYLYQVDRISITTPFYKDILILIYFIWSLLKRIYRQIYILYSRGK